MDDSLSKALIIVAGVLLAMIVIAFFTYSLNKMSSWASSRQDEVQIEQTQKFNKEFEAYDKSLMYGVDVISCLNKAISINDKVKSGTYDKLYEVKIKLNLKNNTKLQDTVTIYHMVSTSGKLREDNYVEGKGPESPYNMTFSDGIVKAGITILKDKSYYQVYPVEFKTVTLDYKNNATNFELTAQLSGSGNNEGLLRELLKNSTELEQIRKNPKSNSSQEKSWTKVVVRCALYTIKTKRFKCNDITYNATTGRVNYMEFSEV